MKVFKGMLISGEIRSKEQYDDQQQLFLPDWNISAYSRQKVYQSA
jgi:hypothetical protein